MIYKIIAKLLSVSFIADYLIDKAKKTPYINIAKGDDVYMERYWLFNPLDVETKCIKYSWIPFSIRIHKILKEDQDRHMHDHPWDCRTFILKGQYLEERVDGVYARREGTTATIAFDDYHKILHVYGDCVYTMFVTGKYKGVWGFLVDGIKIKYKEYLNTEK